MREARLAQDAVNQLAPFIGKLLKKHPLPTNPGEDEKKAYALWEVIYPKVVLRSPVMVAAQKIAEEDTTENRITLSRQLALVFRTNSYLLDRVGEQLGARDLSAGASPIPRRASNLLPKSESIQQEYGPEQITCQVCGKQDETLRLVNYPYVFSLVIITLRRMFQGVYCSHHATKFFFLAGLITLTVGWFGIPFGIIFTPVTLYNLFLAEKRQRPANAKLLLEIAKTKQENGQTKEAAAFLQEALWLDSIETTTPEIQSISRSLLAESQPSIFVQVFSLVSGFAAAWLLGFLIGLLEGMFSMPFLQLNSRVSILVIFSSYLPLVLMLFFSGFVLARFIRKMLEHTQITSQLTGRMVAGVAALIAFYAILVGNLFFFVQMGGGQPAERLMDAIRINGLLLVHGGWLTFVGLFQQGNTADLVFVVLVIFSFMAFILLGQDWAARTVRWKNVMLKIQGRQQADSGFLLAVTAILIVGIVFLPYRVPII